MTSSDREAALILQEAWAGEIPVSEAAALVREVAGQRFPKEWQVADLNGDDRKDWLAVVRGESCGETRLWVVGINREVLQLSVCEPDPCQPCAVAALRDLTGDDVNDAVVRSIFTGAHTETMLYRVITVHDGVLRNALQPELQSDSITDDAAEMTYARAELVDDNKDGADELVITGGLIGSAGAGAYQRETIDVWGWNGEAVVLLASKPAPSDLRLFTLYDANRAYDEGQTQQAQKLYLAAVESDALHDPAELPELRLAIRQFAVFRLQLLALQQGSEDEAQTWKDWFASNHPESPFARAANILFQVWQNSGDVSDACRAVTAEAQKETRPWAPLDDMGYANPGYDAAALCPVNVMRQ